MREFVTKLAFIEMGLRWNIRDVSAKEEQFLIIAHNGMVKEAKTPKEASKPVGKNKRVITRRL